MTSLDEFRMLRGDGWQVRLTQRQAQVVELLLTNDLTSFRDLIKILWAIGDDHDYAARCAVKSHIFNLRKKFRRFQVPLTIRNSYGLGYQLESTMTDPKSRPVIDNAIKAVRGALKESSISDGLTAGEIVYHDDGSASTHHSNKQVDIDVTVTPRKVGEGDST